MMTSNNTFKIVLEDNERDSLFLEIATVLNILYPTTEYYKDYPILTELKRQLSRGRL